MQKDARMMGFGKELLRSVGHVFRLTAEHANVAASQSAQWGNMGNRLDEFRDVRSGQKDEKRG